MYAVNLGFIFLKKSDLLMFISTLPFILKLSLPLWDLTAEFITSEIKTGFKDTMFANCLIMGGNHV